MKGTEPIKTTVSIVKIYFLQVSKEIGSHLQKEMPIWLKDRNYLSTKGRDILQASWEVTGKEVVALTKPLRSQRTFEDDPDQTDCGSLGNSLRKKNHIVPNLDIMKQWHSYCSLFSPCFSINTSLTFSPCNLIRLQLCKKFYTSKMDSIGLIHIQLYLLNTLFPWYQWSHL